MSEKTVVRPSRLLSTLAAYDEDREAEIDYWKAEAFKWQKKYTDLLNENVRNAGESTASVLKAILGGAFATPEERAAREKGDR